MLIVCPSCASEYMIDPGRLGAEGRTVRCASCKSTWFVTPETPESEAASTGDGSADAAAGEDAEAWEQFASANGAPTETAEEPAFPASTVQDSVKVTARVTRARARGNGNRAAAPLLLLLGVALIGTALVGRAHVVRTIPATAALYAGIGLPVNLRGFEFRDVRSEVVGAGADAVLVVEGEIANISGRDAAVPPIEIGVRGAEGQMLYTWTNSPPRGSMAVNDTARFRARLAAPPSEARQVLVRFAPSQDGAAVASNRPGGAGQ